MDKSESPARVMSRYSAIIEKIFADGFSANLDEFNFSRDAVKKAAVDLGIVLPDNVGDIIYSFRYRNDLPKAVSKTAPKGKEWIIEGAGRSAYRFRLVGKVRIVPREGLRTIKVPNATPEIISGYALNDEQALLAKVRYNRLIDIFLGIATYSLQNHLRTTVKGIGQIEVDEIYVGVDRNGRHYVVPVQAKVNSDRHGVVQTTQDIKFCRAKFPTLCCRAISVQSMSDDRIAMFELALHDGEIQIVEEKHYQLVATKDISAADLVSYSADRA